MEKSKSNTSLINNKFYDDLQEAWYTRMDHPIALLRKENQIRIPWIIDSIKTHFRNKVSVLDIGCGGGFLTNALSKEGHEVFGIDLSESSIEVAKKNDSTNSVKYKIASAYDLPYDNQKFDVICAMDVLEHVDNPQRLIEEASRALKPGGLFFFHTFNRNFLSYIFIIKGVEWTVKNTPPNMHVYPLFIRPKELRSYLKTHKLSVSSIKGFGPKLFTFAFLKMLYTRIVPDSFGFAFSKSKIMGYCGYAQKDC